ncbi:hypothetical protein EV368DRAFT_87421 [Lentinula lateritia]|nr:hypothetical protein EV368DRAFT_87421 [Lentinula lateritia]
MSDDGPLDAIFFEKTFLIVPIHENQHWYLAIVHHLELALLPSSEPRPSNTSHPSDVPRDTIPQHKPHDNLIDETTLTSFGDIKSSSETDAEETVHMQLLTFNNPHSPNANEPTVVHPTAPRSSHDESNDPQSMNLAKEHKTASLPPYTPVLPRKAVAPRNNYIYASEPTTRSRPMIFTFDSLGTQHPHVIDILVIYLQLEARDKKRLDNTTKSRGRNIPIPTQPNLLDCGIYMLHFAQVFVKEAEYLSTITQTKGIRPQDDRWVDWDGHDLDRLRHELRTKIGVMSRSWQGLTSSTQ